MNCGGVKWQAFVMAQIFIKYIFSFLSGEYGYHGNVTERQRTHFVR
jgi:hypothetical protein